MRTLMAVLVLSCARVLGVAQTNTDVVPTPASLPPPSVASTNSSVPVVPRESVAFVARDVRTVSGIPVNLGPLHDFERNPTGDRPLKHWKKINFVTAGPLTAGQSICQIRVEGSGEITAVVKNVPKPIIDAYAEVKRLTEEQQKLHNQLAEDSRKVLQAIQTAQANDDTGKLDPAQARKTVAASDQLKFNEADLTKLSQAVAKAQSDFAAIAVEHAMFTGKKAREMEIRDCGIKVK